MLPSHLPTCKHVYLQNIDVIKLLNVLKADEHMKNKNMQFTQINPKYKK